MVAEGDSFSNEEVAALFERLAGLVEVLEGSGFKGRAYRRGAQAIRGLSRPLETMLNEGRDLTEVPGIGGAIAAKVGELFATGQVRAYENARAQLPPYAVALLELPGVGSTTAARIIAMTGARTLEELLRALEAGEVGWLPRSGERSAGSIARGLGGAVVEQANFAGNGEARS